MPAILTYHHIGDPPDSHRGGHLYVRAANFEAQLRRLKERGFRFLSLDELRAGLLDEAALPRRGVALTFDDGFADNHERAFPLLSQYGATAAFFIATDRIGAKDKNGSLHMNAGQLRELDQAGMTIGSHTAAHPRLARLPLEQARRELADSKSALESILGKPVRWLCYPSGSFNGEIAAMAKEMGYAGACSVIRDNRVLARQLYWLPRVMVMRDASVLRFSYYFTPLYHLVHAAKNRRRWTDYL